MLKEKSNLCCSKRPRHVFLIQRELSLSGSFILFALLSIDSINKVIYASKANWYIGSIKLMSFKTKKRIAARCAQDLYSSLARSISFSVCSDTTNDSSIEVEVAFDDCSVLSKSRSSSRVSPATFSRLGRNQKKQRISYWSILSSSSLRVRLLDEIVKTRLSFCSSSCGFSFLTTIPKSWSSSPAHRIIRLDRRCLRSWPPYFSAISLLGIVDRLLMATLYL